MNKRLMEELLDDQQWSPLWEACLRRAKVFDPMAVEEMWVIVPIPDRKGVLIFCEEEVFYNTQSALNTIRHFSFAHCFPDYTILSAVLKDVGAYGKYKLPWACPYFTLCPLEGGPQGVWINPLKIENVYKLEDLHYVQLLNGLKVLIPLQRYYVLVRGEIACGVLAAIRQDAFHFTKGVGSPAHYLTLPNTDFARSLAKRPLLLRFATKTGEIHRRYQRASFLHYYDQFDEEAETSHWENWR